jgi:hypothetical protein
MQTIYSHCRALWVGGWLPVALCAEAVPVPHVMPLVLALAFADVGAPPPSLYVHEMHKQSTVVL